MSPILCKKEYLGDGDWTCHRCGSTWNVNLFGRWLPLSCPDRPVWDLPVRVSQTSAQREGE